MSDLKQQIIDVIKQAKTAPHGAVTIPQEVAEFLGIPGTTIKVFSFEPQTESLDHEIATTVPKPSAAAGAVAGALVGAAPSRISMDDLRRNVKAANRKERLAEAEAAFAELERAFQQEERLEAIEDRLAKLEGMCLVLDDARTGIHIGQISDRLSKLETVSNELFAIDLNKYNGAK